MEIGNDNKQNYLKAKKKVRRIQIFYMHLVAYILAMTFILINIYSIEEEQLRKT